VPEASSIERSEHLRWDAGDGDVRFARELARDDAERRARLREVGSEDVWCDGARTDQVDLGLEETLKQPLADRNEHLLARSEDESARSIDEHPQALLPALVCTASRVGTRE